MKRFRVPVEVWHYYGVYVYAKDEEAAVDRVNKMIATGDVVFDDEGDCGMNVAESGFIDEIDENGNIVF